MSNGGTYMKLPAQTSRSEKWNVPIFRLLRCRKMSRSSAETVLFPLFTLPSPPDTITIYVVPRLLQRHPFSWLHCRIG